MTRPFRSLAIGLIGIAGTWFWIDPVEDLAFVGMVQHQNLGTTRAIHGLSRSLVYQAVIE
jgi:CubicO group peptidase (beta-lactamase class C family)